MKKKKKKKKTWKYGPKSGGESMKKNVNVYHEFITPGGSGLHCALCIHERTSSYLHQLSIAAIAQRSFIFRQVALPHDNDRRVG